MAERLVDHDRGLDFRPDVCLADHLVVYLDRLGVFPVPFPEIPDLEHVEDLVFLFEIDNFLAEHDTDDVQGKTNGHAVRRLFPAPLFFRDFFVRRERLHLCLKFVAGIAFFTILHPALDELVFTDDTEGIRHILARRDFPQEVTHFLDADVDKADVEKRGKRQKEGNEKDPEERVHTALLSHDARLHFGPLLHGDA